jgi:glycerophosphoryl diester phosphodiesterase
MDKKIHIASHSGVFCGAFVRNTIPSFEAALNMGADMIETDVALTADNKLVLFHEGFEKQLLRSDKKIKEMTFDELKATPQWHSHGHESYCNIESFDDLLEHFKNRCVINVDKAWSKIPQIVDCVRRHNMTEQVILKTTTKPEFLSQMEEYGSDVPFMAVLKDYDQMSELDKYKLNLQALEIIFPTLDNKMVSPEVIKEFHDRGLLLWVNAIVYNYKIELSGGLTDDISLLKGPEYGWGKLVDMGFDIIQTDFVSDLANYLKTR